MADVLVVDDDLEATDIVSDVLRDQGHQVRVAHNGSEGLRLLRERLPDLVLLDVEMPVLTGPDMAYKMFLHDVGWEKIPIILCSGILGLRRVSELVGTSYFLPKPYSLDALFGLVARALREDATPRVQRRNE